MSDSLLELISIKDIGFYMIINHCTFPEGYLYDAENFSWVNRYTSNDNTAMVTIGATALLASLAGKLDSIKIKQVGTNIKKGKNLASLESAKFFGVLRSPLRGRIIEVNDSIINRPKIVNDFPYSEGWFAKLEPYPDNNEKDFEQLETIENCRAKMSSLIEQLRIRCFAASPDYEMFEIGVECAATLTKLDELMVKISVGEIVHLVSDDPTADLEIMRWSEQNSQLLLETRREGNLFHFIIKKIK
jgi:glycine cleavage system H lipoate-binding protein/TusA-related sulfurtransferase